MQMICIVSRLSHSPQHRGQTLIFRSLHTQSMQLLCSKTIALELSTRQLERSGSWQGWLQTICWRRIYLHCTEAFSVLWMFQDDTLYKLTYLLTYLAFLASSEHTLATGHIASHMGSRPHLSPHVLPIASTTKAPKHMGCYSFVDPRRIKSWVGLVGWLISFFPQSGHTTDNQSGARRGKFVGRDQRSNHYATPPT